MLVTMEEAKQYLRLDHSEEDTLITSLIASAESLCEDIARIDFASLETTPEIIKISICYAVTYFYENRENANHKELVETLRCLLFGIREEMF